MQTVRIPIGERVEEVPVPNLVTVAEPKFIPGVADPRAEVRRAILSPIGSRPLREIAAGRKRAVIVVNDITRPYPGRLMAEEILRELNAAGMRDDQAALLIAYGQHRENTPEELESIYGRELLGRVKVIHHHAFAPEENRTVGVTRGGVPVSVNRFYLEADLKILTGCIAPHQFAGFSGGRKSVIPGIADIAAVKRHHSFPIRPEKISLGMLEGNRFHLEALEAARMTGVDFIVNSVDNAQREMVACVAGDLEEAFYAGVEISRKVWTVEIPVRPKIVIVSPGGYPRDFDLHQSQKAIGCSELLLPEGGGLILCAECRDGAGKPGELLRRAKSPDEVIDDFLINGLKPNGNGKAYMLARAAKRYFIALAGSRIPQSELREMFLDGYDTVEEAIRVMLERFGQDAPILAVPHASEIIPVFTDKQGGENEQQP